MKYTKETGPVDITPPSLYVIWAAGMPNGPLSGQSGCLAENGRRLFFREKETAEKKIRDLRKSCGERQAAVLPGKGSCGEEDPRPAEPLHERQSRRRL